uniref:Uncharacterized protein n=1 Tax=Ascaris lumbricoides TaxID=6252 RepID=A0A9J2PP45_ASCLU
MLCLMSLFISLVPVLSVTTHSSPTIIYGQCPCVSMPGSGECLPYDAHYQAPNLEDALISFPDLSINDPPDPVDEYPSRIHTFSTLRGSSVSSCNAIAKRCSKIDLKKNSPQVNNELQEYCHSEECKACQSKIRKRLIEVNLLFFFPLIGLKVTLPASDTFLNTSVICNRYRFGRDEPGIRRREKPKLDHERSDDRSSQSSDDDDEEEDHRKRNKKRNHGRHKRQAPGTVGKSYPISCTTKGVSVGENGLLVLCSSCWTWRQLPSNYFPQYINELVCDDSDNACLSGYASCEVGHRTLQVIRNDTGVLNVINLQGGSYCECRVRVSHQ